MTEIYGGGFSPIGSAPIGDTEALALGSDTFPPNITYQGEAGSDPSITWQTLPTGGIVVLDLASAGPASSWVLTRYVYNSGVLVSPTVLLKAPSNQEIYFIDLGDGTNTPLNPANLYVYEFSTSEGQVRTDPITVSGTIILQPDHLTAIMVRALQAGLQSLVVPGSFAQRPTFSFAMPITTQMRFPMILLNLDLLQQEEIPIGQGVIHPVAGQSMYNVPAMALRRYIARLYTTTVEERDFYRDAIIGIFNTILTPLFQKVGVNTNHSFQASNGQIVGDQMQPGAFYAEVAMQFSGLYNVAVSTHFPLIGSFDINPTET